MFLERLTQLLSNAFHAKPKYITVSPVAGTGPVAALPPAVLPRHVAIIMDGNGRWAKQHNMPRSAGHAAGTEALRDIIRASDDWGIEALSLYAFSTENWARSKDEVEALMGLLLKYFASEIDELDAKNVRITILGDVDGLPGPQREAVVNAMQRTRNNDGLKLNIALNYGGRAELTRAARILAQQVRDGVIDPEDITEDVFAEELYTADSPDVDLLIRTSGEQRTSNFLPWQLTYAEFIFDNTYWPDFNRERYMKCLREYAGRERRFGRENAEPAREAAKAEAEAEADDTDNIILEVTPVLHSEPAPGTAKARQDEIPHGVSHTAPGAAPVFCEEPAPASPAIDDTPEEPESMLLEAEPDLSEDSRPAPEVPEPAEASGSADNFVLEVTPVLSDAPEGPSEETEGTDNIVLEVTPVLSDAPAPEGPAEETEGTDNIVLEVTPVLSDAPAPAGPAEETEATDNIVLEVTPVLFPRVAPEAEGAIRSDADAAEEPDNTVLEITPVISGARPPEPAPAPKAKARKRSRAKAPAKSKAAQAAESPGDSR